MKPFRLLLALPPLVLLALTAARAADEDELVVLTPTGHRLAGRLADSGPGPFVGLRIGAAVYELERTGGRFQGPAAARLAEGAWAGLVGDLVDRLTASDPELAAAAGRALLALGPRAEAPLRRALDGARRPEEHAALEALVATFETESR